MRAVLHILSVAGTFMMLFGSLYIVLAAILSMIPWFRKATVLGIPLELPVCSLIAVLVILRFVEISSPYK